MTSPNASLVDPLIEQTIEVDASPARVWALVSDLPRLAEWSPQVVRTFLRGGRPVRMGSRMVNLNRRGLLLWPTTASVVRFVPEREIAFLVRENGATWSFTLEPAPGDTADPADPEGTAGAGGTRIIQRREAAPGLSTTSLRLTDRVLGGQVSFQAELRQGMEQTLRRIKAEAERG